MKVFDGAVLGHRRLRIIDLHPSADQPTTEEQGRYWIVFNGEIYNFPELRARLEAAGHRFVSHSDTEVIVHLVEEHGEDFAEHLRGMFALVVWDTGERTLLLVRDRLGIKPLYYQLDRDRLLLSSEAHTLPAAGGLLDEYSVAAYLALGWVPGPQTIYRGVHELPPGHRLRWRAGTHQVRRWWTLPSAAEGGTLEDLGAALADSVTRHLVADVPVGVFLSAGLDSAVNATLASRTDADTTAYTVAFSEAPDETEGAKQIASRLGLPHQVVHVSGEDVLASIDRVVASMDQPTVDGLNSWVVSRGARDCGAVVALSGLGGDELFAGYSTFRHVPRIAGLLDRAAPLPAFLRAAPSLAFGLSRRTSHTRVGRVLEAARVPGPAAAYAAVRGPMSFREVERLRGGWGRDLRRHLPVHVGDGARGVTGLELANYLPYQLLRDTDAMSMAHSPRGADAPPRRRGGGRRHGTVSEREWVEGQGAPRRGRRSGAARHRPRPEADVHAAHRLVAARASPGGVGGHARHAWRIGTGLRPPGAGPSFSGLPRRPRQLAVALVTDRAGSVDFPPLSPPLFPG